MRFVIKMAISLEILKEKPNELCKVATILSYPHQVKGQLLPAKFRDLNRFNYRQRSRRYDGDFREDAKDVVPEDVLASRKAWHEGDQFAKEYENKKGRVKERQFELPDPVPATLDPSPTLPNAVPLRESMHESMTDSEASTLSMEGSRFKKKPIAHGNATVAPTVRSTAVSIPPQEQPVFTENDFPPLSSSESEGPGTPPRQTSMRNARKQHSGNLQTEGRLERNGSHPDRAMEPGLYTLLRESASLPGRGRASALLRKAALPTLRMPAEDSAPAYHRYEPSVKSGAQFADSRSHGCHFPADEDLLAAPEIVPVPQHHTVGGTKVRIRLS